MRLMPLVLAALLFTSVSPSADSWSLNAERIAKSVVMVTNDHGLCTGFVINPRVQKKNDPEQTYILTAAHCYGDDLYADEEPAKVVYKDEKKDLLVLEIADTGRPALHLAKEDPKVGDEVGSFGFGYGNVVDQALFRVAHISAKNLFIATDGIGGPLFALDATFVSGQSGGPVINAAGELVMIVQVGTPSVGFGVGADILKSKVGKYFDKPAQP